MFKFAKKLLTAAICAVCLSSVAPVAWGAGADVSVYLKEVDPYGVRMNYFSLPAAQRVVDTYGYNNYRAAGATWWTVSGGSVTIDDNDWQRIRALNVPLGARIKYTHFDRFDQALSITHAANTVSEVVDLEKGYSSFTVINPDGTPYTGALDFSIRVGKSGLKSLGQTALRHPSRTAECKQYNSFGYTSFLTPRIWTGGADEHSIYVLWNDTEQTIEEMTYGAFGAYTQNPWDASITINPTTRSSGEKKLSISMNTKINKNKAMK